MDTIFVVENRENSPINYCIKSIQENCASFEKIETTDGGSSYEFFKQSYVHMSSNSKEFELICFRRYFILKEFLEKKSGIENFVLLDSDVLVFDGFVEHFNKLIKNEKFIGSVDKDFESDFQISPHASYWTREALFDFVEFLSLAYKESNTFEKLKEIEIFFKKRKKFGGVSDMTLLYVWAKDRGHNKQINAILDNSVVDHNIGIGRNGPNAEFKTIFGFKNVYFRKNGVYLLSNNGNYVRCYIMHFQGKAKLLMKWVSKKNKIMFVFQCAMISFARKIKKISYKLP